MFVYAKCLFVDKVNAHQMKFMLFHKLFFRNEAVEFRMTFSPHTYKPTCGLQVIFLSKRFKTRGNFIKKRPILVMQVKINSK